MSSDFSSVLIPGPWSHDFVSANGTRFHVAQAGGEDRRAPLVVFLHSFPQFWWAWRHQLEAVADAGFHAVAMDLRGVGASDKPPQGYDVPTRTRDVAGVVRALGAEHAVIVGHGSGALVAWAMAAYQPALTAGVVAINAAHPARLHCTARETLTRSALARLAFLQLPQAPERAFAGKGLTRTLLQEWSARTFTDDELDTYESAMAVLFAAHSATEAMRWLFRSSFRPDGLRFRTRMRRPVDVPVLQIQSREDPVVVPSTAAVDAAALCRDYRLESVPGAHFAPEEQADLVSGLVTEFLRHPRLRVNRS